MYRTIIKICFFALISQSSFSRNLTDIADTISLKDRITIASNAYSALNNYFAHFVNTSQLQTDSIYDHYLNEFINTNDRYSFALLMKSFLGEFHNGHTWYRDKYLDRKYSQPLGFTFRYLGNEWILLTSIIKDIKPGDIITIINDQAFEEYYQTQKKYICNSSDYGLRTAFASQREMYLFPQQFTIETQTGRKIFIDRGKTDSPAVIKSKSLDARWLIPSKVAYIKIAHLNNNEQELIDIFHQFKMTESLVIDIRGYAGGNTPQRFVDLLMDQPYRYFNEGTNMNIGLFQFYGKIGTIFANELDSADKVYYSVFKDHFTHPSIIWPASYIQPATSGFKGKIIILVDGGTVSAKEDFVLPFKDNHRAVIIGEQTMGSSGQPFFYNFNTDIQVAVGTKRLYFPDGSLFEGKGITPDITVLPTAEDIKLGRDPAFDKAVQMAVKDQK